ncbi:adenylate/guanylate cyclase domain-containing protein [Variovorax sp. dw_308]|uniref:adenylate/guanylate cyclase domain-containing protein n=1 Tax=Variovorax sp. dw_308 TaxID=2721546 RepID=UPI001C491840
MNAAAPPPSWVCSVLYLQPARDLKWDAAAMPAWPDALRTLVRRILAGIPVTEYTLFPTGEGIAIGFLRDAEAAMTAVFRLTPALHDDASPVVRAGIHAGVVMSGMDGNGHPSLFGDGVDVAARVMQHASAGQIQASAEFRDALGHLSSDYRPVFAPSGSFTEGDGRQVGAFLLTRPPSELRMRLEARHGVKPVAAPAQPEPDAPAAPAASTAPEPVVTTEQQILKTISTWILPFNALAAFVGIGISWLERLAPGGSLTRIGFFASLGLAVAIALLDLMRVTGWPAALWARPGKLLRGLGSRAATVLSAVVTLMFGFCALVLSPAKPAEPAPAVATPPSVTVPASAVAAPQGRSSPSPQPQPQPQPQPAPQPAPKLAEPANPPSELPAAPASPQSAPAAVAAKSAPLADHPARKPETRPPATASSDPSARTEAKRAATAAQCSDIVSRASLGAPLSPAEAETLRSRCR